MYNKRAGLRHGEGDTQSNRHTRGNAGKGPCVGAAVDCGGVGARARVPSNTHAPASRQARERERKRTLDEHILSVCPWGMGEYYFL